MAARKMASKLKEVKKHATAFFFAMEGFLYRIGRIS